MWLTIVDPQGQQHQEQVSGPGGRIRFAVGSHTKRSTVWRVWANKNKGDVYVAARVIAGIQKFSLHESGDWRYQWVSRDASEQWGGDSGRILDRWERPEGIEGWTRALTIWVPYGHLSDTPDEAPDDEILWLPEPQPGRKVRISIAVVAPNQGGIEIQGLPVAAVRLSTGEAVVVLYWQDRMPENPDPAIVEALRHVRLSAEQVANLLSAKAPRMGVFGWDQRGTRVVWDLRLDGISPDGPRECRQRRLESKEASGAWSPDDWLRSGMAIKA
jgi:hypothetical protein